MTLDTLKKLFTFSWSQVWSDQNGKSSGSAWSGWFLCVVGGIGFLKCVLLKESDGMMYSLGFATLGAGLLGYHKAVEGPPKDLGVTDDHTASMTKTETATSTIEVTK